jgi:hypothetical protein
MTMAWQPRRPLVFFLGVLAAALVVLVGLEAALGPHADSAAKIAARKPAAPADTKLLPPMVATTAEQYSETAARPLFTPTRRPAPEAAGGGQNSFTPGQYVLQGVIIVGDNRVAMLREKATGRVHRVERGKELNGIQVVDIQPEAVKLALGSQSEVVPLVVQKGPAVPGAAQAVAPQGAVPGQAPGPFGPTHPQVPAPPTASAQGHPAAPALGFTPSEKPAQGAGAPVTPLQGVNPGQSSLPQATPAAPMTPEELLARRRARRGLQNN